MQQLHYAHHRETVERVTAQLRSDPTIRALIIGGSLVKGYGREDSDVDIIVIVDQEEFDRRQTVDELLLYKPEWSTYEGGYVDGKVLPYQFLLDAAEKGSEPTRWSFVKSIIAFSDIPELPETIARIVRYPIEEQEAKITSFYGQFMVWSWFIGEAVRHDNIYLLTRAATGLVLYGSRLILAHNQMLYPFHKWLMREMERVPDKPADFIPLAEALLRSPGRETADAFCNAVTQFREWGMSMPEAFMAFVRDSERTWMTQRPALEDW